MRQTLLSFLTGNSGWPQYDVSRSSSRRLCLTPRTSPHFLDIIHTESAHTWTRQIQYHYLLSLVIPDGHHSSPSYVSRTTFSNLNSLSLSLSHRRPNLMKTITEHRRARQEQLHGAVVVDVVDRCAAQAWALPPTVHGPHTTHHHAYARDGQASSLPMANARGSWLMLMPDHHEWPSTGQPTANRWSSSGPKRIYEASAWNAMF